MSTVNDEPRRQWWDFREELRDLARVLVDTDWLSTPADVLDFLDKPWKWSRERELWWAAGKPSPDEPARWGAFLALLEASGVRPDRPPLAGL